ncbi:MAG: galactose-1-phosphate uridylyltransferase [Clostridiales bacterium]|nr:galactose-1-phosphate uridylyltransferase [Clostridiales bacterium]
MAELRWNPMTKDWVMVISNRAKRPNMPKDYCPFCPGSGKVPDNYKVYKYDNDFPALSNPPAEMNCPVTPAAQAFYKTAPAYGKCEVILFSPDHHGKLYDLDDDHMGLLVDLWQQRFNELSADEKIKYVFIFENRGKEVGVTQPHPHGQIYGYPFMPKKIELELDSAKEFFAEQGRCLFCSMNEEEVRFGKRVICENEDFVAYVPFFSEYAYGVYISAKKHVQHIGQFDEQMKANFGRILRNITGMYDCLFDTIFPYMMCMHNAPVNVSGPVADCYHFHVEMLTPMRSANVQQYRASSESGVWASCNPSSPEENAAQLREALDRFLQRNR